MNDITFTQIQVVQLRKLLEDAGDDPVLVPQLRQRLDDAEKELKALEQPGTLFPSPVEPLPRVAVFLKGGGVQGTEGIRPVLAGEALIQYERMFIEQALHDEREAAKEGGRTRRRRGSESPHLLFSGTPRGSFGLEFVPQRLEDASLQVVHSQALHHVADALVQVGNSNLSFEQAIENISPRVLRPMKRFLKILAQFGAEVRLAFSNAPSKSISAQEIKNASERLEQQLDTEELTVTGIFRGMTRESLVFDLMTDNFGLVTGTMADNLTEEDFDRISALTNTICTAEIQKTTIHSAAGGQRVSYILLDAKSNQPGSTTHEVTR